ncbi:TPA: uracil phosphoribosyltransferase [Candidatus Dependentiae bacterium]|nr:MAG: Uracil phosphoribosyltransferase [candidate division TM6 bacterium GW2011_GWF2_36_131]KKQ03516.1 MAG: Uracil phosphoribosyltransferase [candidate division TM6 bacterium GW2011_GWE2_36_25]KKQ20210.1 MAG: Uracil phosphoribosyltransferase [candidate division TM6 bacterium GW2011_GWA2_36_9]HBR70750.1 uracil phosphoribosyltransferase [Candidatus Dependentiae bacterium]HCU00135.1 uracil phosphoribosyltransferase [Candidatus Dependentiae bacterium]
MKKIKNLLMTTLRNKETSMTNFRGAADKLALVLAQEAADYLETISSTITTPLNTQTTGVIIKKNLILVPILRSGLALVPAFLHFYPQAKIGVIGAKRDEETAIAHLYYKNLPPISADDQVIVLDPMLATGGSLLMTLKILIDLGIKEEQILFVGVICATEGYNLIKKEFPKINMIIAAQDSKLNDKKYIIPGLGDFGDRYFGTE